MIELLYVGECVNTIYEVQVRLGLGLINYRYRVRVDDVSTGMKFRSRC